MSLERGSGQSNTAGKEALKNGSKKNNKRQQEGHWEVPQP